MKKIDAGSLTEAQETLLIPLWARAVSHRHGEPILPDPRAIELMDSIDYPFERFEQANVDAAGFCIRGRIIDRLVEQFLDAHPTGTVVEMGVGLDTRFDRLDNGTVSWLEVDLPEAMELRRQLIAETPRRRQECASVLETDWLDILDSFAPIQVLFVAEGVFYFLGSRQVQTLLQRLADRFPGSAVVFDCQSPLLLAYNNWRQPVRNAQMQWSVRRARDLEAWDPRFCLEQYIGFGDGDYYPLAIWKRLPLAQRLLRRLWPPSRHLFKICRLRLGAATEGRRISRPAGT
ncbi:MAG: class I SAM-dependent methyltransferase [Pirellulaceae bacterium]|nr:class I SAM-dependent methyltransferase [Pirellulaceae bacterium]